MDASLLFCLASRRAQVERGRAWVTQITRSVIGERRVFVLEDRGLRKTLMEKVLAEMLQC